ncbi:hypothetical protein J7J18_03735 [bacterium]|nr:hypothetical protein [bacterium]
MRGYRPEWLYSYRFRCKICGFEGKTWSEVASHLLKKHGKRNYYELKENIEYLGLPEDLVKAKEEAERRAKKLSMEEKMIREEALRQFRKCIKDLIEDEKKAQIEYKTLADLCEALGFHGEAQKLREIHAEEVKHQAILESIFSLRRYER